MYKIYTNELERSIDAGTSYLYYFHYIDTPYRDNICSLRSVALL